MSVTATGGRKRPLTWRTASNSGAFTKPSLTAAVEDVSFLGAVVLIKRRPGEAVLHADAFNAAGALPEPGETVEVASARHAIVLGEGGQPLSDRSRVAETGHIVDCRHGLAANWRRPPFWAMELAKRALGPK